jgi:hypothetical protein
VSAEEIQRVIAGRFPDAPSRARMRGSCNRHPGRTSWPQNLMILSATTMFVLGVVHLVYTYWGSKLAPRDPALQISMSQISPVISKQTTMWRAWVGFNVSHSMRLILFGLVFGFLHWLTANFSFGHRSCSLSG